MAREEQRKTKRSIDAAVRAERKKWEAEARANNNGNSNSRSCRDTASSCPACPVCDCPETDAIVNTTTCSAHCSDMSETCRKLGDDNFVYKLLLLLEDVFPVQLVPMIVLSFLVVGFLYALQWVWTLLFNPRAYTNYDYGNYGSINDEMLLATAPGPTGRQQPSSAQQVQNVGANIGTTAASTPRPPTASLSLANYQNGPNGITNHNGNHNHGTNTPSFFSPGGGSQMGSPPGRFDQTRSPSTAAPGSALRDTYSYEGGGSSVYQSPPLIVPSRNGEGGRRRTPYR